MHYCWVDTAGISCHCRTPAQVQCLPPACGIPATTCILYTLYLRDSACHRLLLCRLCHLPTLLSCLLLLFYYATATVSVFSTISFLPVLHLDFCLHSSCLLHCRWLPACRTLPAGCLSAMYHGLMLHFSPAYLFSFCLFHIFCSTATGSTTGGWILPYSTTFSYFSPAPTCHFHHYSSTFYHFLPAECLTYHCTACCLRNAYTPTLSDIPLEWFCSCVSVTTYHTAVLYHLPPLHSDFYRFSVSYHTPVF